MNKKESDENGDKMKNNHTTKPNAVVYVWQQNERSDHFKKPRK